MNSNSLLVVEDETKIRVLMDSYLTQHGFSVRGVDSGERALETMMSQNFDLIVLDLNLPRLDGIDVLRAVRRRGMCPVIVVSARQEDRVRLEAFEIGADDYLTKPYNPRELVARIHALLRRARPGMQQRKSQTLRIQEEEETVYLYGEPVNLTPTEFELLHVLASEPGRVFSREELLQRVWGGNKGNSLSRRVDLYISRLRARIHEPGGDDLILSVFKRGYRLKPSIEVIVEKMRSGLHPKKLAGL